jgi:dolichol-phosphate mannosyltransferase
MDADLSHDPEYLPELIKHHTRAQNCVVFSSRYLPNGRIEEWGPWRRIISYVANSLARIFLWISLSDLTSSYRVYSRDVFETIVKKSVADGFAFQIEAAFWSKRHCASTPEVPIVFHDRAKGRSKFNLHEIFAFAWILVRYLIIVVFRLYLT